MRISTLLPLLGLLALGYAKKCPSKSTSPGKEILCYTSSNDVEELLDTICRCTTLVHQGYELHNISLTGVDEFQKALKEINPVLQFVISVTDPQGTLKTSATTRQEASGRLAQVLSEVDGVELDMSAGSKERLSHFVKGLKDEMIRKSNEKRIVLALPTKAEQLAKQYDLKSLTKYVDLFTLSTDYLVDETESYKTFHPSRLMGIFDMLNTDSLVDLVSGMGVQKKKLLVSVPASAYKFMLKKEDKNVPGSMVEEEEPTAISRKELCDMMSAGEWTVERDTDLTAPYAFKDSTWISYEDKISVGIKGKYVLLRELAGLGIHDVDSDVKTECGEPITYDIYRSFTEMKRKTRGAVLASLENDLQVQVPQSRHVRSSEFRIVRVVDTAGAIHAIRENTQTEFTCTRQGYFVHPKSCNRFYRCVKFDQGVDDYSVFEFDCPAGLAFDERTEVCVWPGSITEGSACPGSSEIAPVPRARFQCPERDGYYADPQNCRWFFACFDLGEPELTAYEFRCPFGLVFDEQKLICEWPWLVPSCGGGSGYSRTEYGSGSVHTIGQNGHGGYGQGSGDHSGSGIGIGQGAGHESGLGGGYAGSQGIGFGGAHGNGQGIGSGSGQGIGFGGAHGNGQGIGSGNGQGINFGGAHGNGQGIGSGNGQGINFGGAHGNGQGIGSGSGQGNSFGVAHGNGQGIGSGNGQGIGFGGAHGNGQGLSSGEGHGISHGIGSGSGQGNGFGDDQSGQYGGGLVSQYQGSKADESRQSETEAGNYDGVNSNGVNYAGQGAGGAGGYTSSSRGANQGQYSGQGASGSGLGSGYTSAGISGSGNFGGSGYSGSGANGFSNSGSGSNGLGYSGANSAYSGSGSSTGGASGSRANVFGNGAGISTVSSGYTGAGAGAGFGSSGNSGLGVTNSAYSGISSVGLNQNANRGDVSIGAGNFGAGKYTTASGSGSSQSGYSSQSGSISDLSGLGKPIAVVETLPFGQGQGSSAYQTGSTGSASGNYGGSDSGANKYTTSSQFFGKTSSNNAYDGAGNNGVVIETGSGLANGGYTGAGFVVNTGLSGSDGVYNGQGGNDGQVVLNQNGATGSQYVTSSGHYSGHQAGNTGYSQSSQVGGSDGGSRYTSGGRVSDSQDVINGGLNSGAGVFLTGTTANGNSGYSSVSQNTLKSVNPAYNVFGVKGTSAPAVFVQTVTPQYAITGSGQSDSSSYVTGSNYATGNGQGYVSGAPGLSYGNGESAHRDSSSSSTYSDNGKGEISTGTSTIHGNGGSSNSFSSSKTNSNGGYNRQGAYVTSNGDSGSVQTGSFGVTGRPAYASTSPANAGYVINTVTETVTPGVFLTPTPAPGVILRGTPAPSQIYEGAGIRGPIGGTTYHGNTGNVYRGNSDAEYTAVAGDFGIRTTSGQNNGGYETNEYHDNGGRGTVTYNNGYSTSKLTEGDVNTRQPAYASLPDSIVSGGRIDGSNGVVLGNTLAGINSYTSQGFTKTGVTKTGINTAQIGGSGSYVTSSGYSRPSSTASPDNIGSKAFGGQRQYQGSSIGNDVNNLAYVTSTASPDVSYVDTSKINLGYTSGYSYNNPTVKFVASSTPSPLTVTYHEPIVPLTATTPSSVLNVEVYNTPSVVTSAPITAAPAVVNTYSYRKPEVSSVSSVSTGYTYRRPSQNFAYKNSGDGVQQTTVYQRRPTQAPIAFATRPADVYKTTLFEAAKKPITLSTLAPVYNTGYKTVVSSTAAPIAVTTGQYYYTDSRLTGQTSGNFDGSNQQSGFNSQKQYVSSTVAPNTEDGYTYEKPREQLTYNSPSTVSPPVYRRPSVTVKQQVNYVPSSTFAPDFNGQYDSTSASIRPSTYQGRYSVSSTAATASGSQGYDYSKPSVKFVSSTAAPVSQGYEYSKPGVKFVSSTLAPVSQGYEYSKPGVKFVSSTSAPYYAGNSEGYSNGNGGSPTKVDIPQSEVTKLVNNYDSSDRGGIRYRPNDYDDVNIGNSGFGLKTPTSGNVVTAKPFQATTPDSVIDTNAYTRYTSGTRGYSFSSKTSGYSGTTPLYEVDTVKPSSGKGKGKVIVKLSDLHPLLLGKLGAQCTCRSDPFETLRGPGAKLIQSSRGQVDLANYDESQIYVDLEGDREPSQSAAVYRTPNNSPSYSSSPRTPVSAVFGVSSPAPVLRGRGRPSTAYLPVSATPSPITKSRGGPSAYQSSGDKESYEVSSDNLDPQVVNGPSGFTRGDNIPLGRSAGSRIKGAKSLRGFAAGKNAVGGAGASFDRYGPGGWRDAEETLQGGSDCARPGLFRHPKFCNKFYACHFDEWKQKYTLHVFNCPVHLSFDGNAGACNWPSKGPACQDDNLLV